MQRDIEIGFRAFQQLGVVAAQQGQHVQVAADARKAQLALARLLAQTFQGRVEARHGVRVFAAQQGDAAVDKQRLRPLLACQVARGGVEFAAQQGVFGQGQRQGGADMVAGRRLTRVVRARVGTDGVRRGRLARGVAQQHGEDVILQLRHDERQHLGLERAAENLDQRMQLLRFIARHAGGQDGGHLAHFVIAQQGDAQARHALPVTAQFHIAIPVAAHGVDGFDGLAQVAERQVFDGRAHGGPAQLRFAGIAASHHLGRQRVPRQMLQHARDGEQGKRRAVRLDDIGALQVFIHGMLAHRLARNGQQGQDHAFVLLQGGEFVQQELVQMRVGHAGKLAICTGGAPAATGRPNTRW